MIYECFDDPVFFSERIKALTTPEEAAEALGLAKEDFLSVKEALSLQKETSVSETAEEIVSRAEAGLSRMPDYSLFVAGKEQHLEGLFREEKETGFFAEVPLKVSGKTAEFLFKRNDADALLFYNEKTVNVLLNAMKNAAKETFSDPEKLFSYIEGCSHAVDIVSRTGPENTDKDMTFIADALHVHDLAVNTLIKAEDPALFNSYLKEGKAHPEYDRYEGSFFISKSETLSRDITDRFYERLQKEEKEYKTEGITPFVSSCAKHLFSLLSDCEKLPDRKVQDTFLDVLTEKIYGEAPLRKQDILREVQKREDMRKGFSEKEEDYFEYLLSEASLGELETFLGRPLTEALIKDLPEAVRETAAKMPKEVLENFVEEWGSSFDADKTLDALLKEASDECKTKAPEKGPFSHKDDIVI